MPSPRPVKPSRSVVVALTLTRSGVDAERSRRCAARIAARCGPIFGASQIRVTSTWASAPPRARDALRGVAQEDRPRRRRSSAGRTAGSAGRCRRRRSRRGSRRSARAAPTSASEWPTRPRSCGTDAAEPRRGRRGRSACTSKPLPVARCPRRARDQALGARARSSAVVILKFASSPGDQRDREPGALGDRRVVGRALRRPRRGARRGCRRSGSPAASARATGRRAAPSPPTRPPAPRFSVSATGSAGEAPGAAASAASTASIDSARRRRAARRRGSAPRGWRGAAASRPRRTESCRCAPPATGGSRSRPSAASS